VSRTVDPLVCAGCGATVPWTEPFPFRCPEARPGDDVDHVLGRRRAPVGFSFPAGDEPHPFVRFRRLSYSWQVARAGGMEDAEYVALVETLDGKIAAVDGRGFAETPYLRCDDDELGVWIKDETGNVAGSHKGRHLFGIAIFLQVAERVGLVDGAGARRPLAIASCGNAALAAAVIARALARHLDVFIPTWADPAVVERLRSLGATLVVCERLDTDPPGDPCYLRFLEALGRGAIPFTCQGNQNGLTIDGGRTLCWELVEQHAATGAPPLDRLFVQVGGGALCSSTIQGLRWANQLGALSRMPRIHAVQTQSSHPLDRAFRAVVEASAGDRSVEETLAHAAAHRSLFMQPADEEPRSIATGILDDETYDWLEVVRGMLETGGSPILVAEETLASAREAGRSATGTRVGATGAAGLAGWMTSREAGIADPVEQVAVLFTG